MRRLIKRAVKPLPSGGGYKAHLNWNFCLSAFSVLTGDTAAGHAVSACGEIVRPGGVGGWFVPVKFPTWECLRRKPSLVPLGSLGEAGTRSGTQSQDCLRWESPDFRRGRMSIFCRIQRFFSAFFPAVKNSRIVCQKFRLLNQHS